VDDKSRSWLSGYSEGEAMPEQLIDSIKIKTEAAFSDKLKMPVKMCFHKYKSDIHFESGGTNGILEGLPENTFKRGKEDCPQNNRYISLDVQIYPSGGTSITIGTTKTKLKPRLQITAKVVDENKTEVWRKDIAIKDFAKLRSETAYYGSVEITKSEVLSPFDIYAMYLMGLDELIKE
jgi:predicted type IV restriction endonuclease